MLALHIELGDVAVEPGSESAASRLLLLARQRGIPEAIVQADLANMRARRDRSDARRAPRTS
jgi:hypothetical protein